MNETKRKNLSKQAIKIEPDIATMGTSITSTEAAVSVKNVEYFEGPLPPPELLSQYNKTLKGAADRMITMAEKQGKHRRELEKQIVQSSIRNERIGMYFAFIITIGLMIAGAWLISMGHDVAGYLSFFGPALFHAANYLLNRSKD